jgi:hypothetical protein
MIWSELRNNNTQDFLNRFSYCHDGLIRNICIIYTPKGPKPDVEISASVIDYDNTDKWVNLKLVLHKVSESALILSKGSHQVISYWRIKFFDKELFMALDPWSYVLDTQEEYRKSSIYFVCESCKWGISEYGEQA